MINSGSRFARHRRVEEGMRLLVQNAQQQIAAANNQQPYVQQAGNEDERIPPNIPLVPAMQEIQQPQVENCLADPIPVAAGNELHLNEDNNGEGIDDEDDQYEEGLPRRPNDVNLADGNNLTDEEVVRWMAKIKRDNPDMTGKCLRDVAILVRAASNRNLPIDPRTILHTDTTTVGDGDFIHIGLMKGLLLKVNKGMQCEQNRNIVLQINMDGLPLYKSNTKELWPILVRVLTAKDTHPFVVSLFVGKTKPPSVEAFVRPFLDELKPMMENGITIGDAHFNVKVANFVCDAPARQFVKCIAGHCGREACERCDQRGIYDKRFRAMTFPELEKITLRSDLSFRRKKTKGHHKGTSPFEELCIDMIQSFPLDYMHLVLLGVFKRLLQIWTGSWNKKWRTHKLGNHHLEAINRRMRLIRFSYPKEFHRIPTSLKNVGGLKAVELRSILLYSGPVLFKGILSKEKYEHFLYLHIGENDNEIAKDCLKYFSDQFGRIYGRNHLIYNVHSLSHLADDAAIHGALDKFSSFPFETYLGRIKKLVRSSNKPLAQIVRRISELQHVDGFDFTIQKSIFNPSNPHRTIFTELKIQTRSDSFYLTNQGFVVKVTGFDGENIWGNPFYPLKNLYIIPEKSKRLNIFQSRGMQPNTRKWSRNELQLDKKCWVMPLPGSRGGCAILPFLHKLG